MPDANETVVRRFVNDVIKAGSRQPWSFVKRNKNHDRKNAEIAGQLTDKKPQKETLRTYEIGRMIAKRSEPRKVISTTGGTRSARDEK